MQNLGLSLEQVNRLSRSRYTYLGTAPPLYQSPLPLGSHVGRGSATTDLPNADGAWSILKLLGLENLGAIH